MRSTMHTPLPGKSFTHELSTVTDNKLLVAIFKKDVASLLLIIQASKNTTKNTPIQQKNTIQPEPLVFITDLQSRQP